MKIKTVKKLNLPELIKHVWENVAYPSRFVPEEFGTTRYVEFFDGGMFRTGHGLHENDTFTVEVEEELTEETVFRNVIIVVKDPKTNEKSVSWRIEHSIESIRVRYGQEMLTISAVDEEGEPTLIWKKYTGIPEEGVIEV